MLDAATAMMLHAGGILMPYVPYMGMDGLLVPNFTILNPQRNPSNPTAPKNVAVTNNET